MTGLKHRVEAAQAPIVARLRERDRRSGLNDVTGEPAAGGAP